MASRFDGWVNALTGLGGIRDKVMAYVFARLGRLDDGTLEAMYDEDDMAARIAEAVPEHMLRRGFTIKVEGNPDLGKAAEKYLAERGAVPSLVDAMVWERVFGGGVCVLGLDDGQDVSLPLDESRIASLRFINVLDRRDVLPVYWYSDPSRERYGLPEVYRITYLVQGMQRSGVEPYGPRRFTIDIHETRLIVFAGLRTTLRSRLRNAGWGSSLLSKLRGPLRTFHGNWQSVENLMQDCSQGVFKMTGLHDAIASGNQAALQERMTLLDMSRSVARAIMIDKDGEEFERRDTTMSGLPDLLDRTAQRLAAGAKTPVTVLMGISPAGLNATGASDIRNWYDSVENERAQRLQGPVENLVRLVWLAQDGPTGGVEPENWTVTFPSLWQETAQEKAQTAQTQTTSDVALVQAGVLTPEEVALRRAEELEIDTEARESALTEYQKKLASGEGDLPPRPALPGDPSGQQQAGGGAPPALPAPKGLNGETTNGGAGAPLGGLG